MRSFTKFILPQTGLFTMALIFISAIYNIVGNSPEKLLFINLLIIIGGGFLLSCVEYYLLPSVWQASARRGLFFSCLTWYVGIGVLMLVTGWVGFSVPNLIAFTIDFLIVYFLFTWYNIYRLKMDAEEINRYLENRNADK
ncbi:MAG: DUF3021 family protein [Lachnospiraceae bacterium]|nr:DUF3021 family protein [Lachnospiraceae bacterium]